MKKLLIIYGIKRNYKGIDFMDYSLIEKGTNENLMLKWYDFMRIWETKKQTEATFRNWLETQENKLKEAGFNYWDTIHELRYWEYIKPLPFN